MGGGQREGCKRECRGGCHDGQFPKHGP
jgi:hypothetical protein